MLASAGTLGQVSEQPFSVIQTADGIIARIDCDSVEAINRYMMSEDNTNMTKADFLLFKEFIRYSDGEIGATPELLALDEILVTMFNTGLQCSVIQGV